MFNEGAPLRNALGVYIFAGGFTLGVEKHFNVLAHFEDKPYAGTDTVALNRPNIPIHFRSKGEWEKFAPTYEPDFIYANPPCAVFSPIGISITKGSDFWRKDARINCWLRSYAFIERNPAVLAIESVPQALVKGMDMIRALAKDAVSRGYSVTILQHDAAHQGTPHHRKRFMFIAHRIALHMPKLNWSPAPTVDETLSSVKDPGYTIPHNRTDLDEIYEKMQLRNNGRWEGVRTTFCRIHNIPQDSKDVKHMPMFMLHRLNGDYPPGCFTGNYWLHPHEPRYIGVQEMKALTGYPQDYELAGSKGMAATLLAQAVMPDVGEWVARGVRDSLDINEPITNPRVYWEDLRTAPGIREDRTDFFVNHDIEQIEFVPEKVTQERGPRIGTPSTKRLPVSHDWLDKSIEVLVQSNPRRPGSNTYVLFDLYAEVKTVRSFLQNGGRLVDIRHDVERNHIRLVGNDAGVPDEARAVGA